MGTTRDYNLTGDYTLAELEALPTLCESQADDLKVETGTTRVWLCRCGIEDGMPFDNAVTIEKLVNGRWVERWVYPANLEPTASGYGDALEDGQPLPSDPPR